MFGKKREKIAIPVGLSRKSMFLSVEQMAELYDHWRQRDLTLPIFNSRSKDAQPSAVKTEQQREMVYQSLALFLMQYLCCGCNLIDLALLEYNSFYFDNHQKAFRFIRRKTANETSDGDGMEVIVPIIEPMRVIIDSLGAKPKLGSRVFPFLLGDIDSFDGEAIRKRIHQCNKDIAERMAKVAADIGWTVKPTGTYARHSFATNLHSAKLPMPYISDAMGHSLGNRGQITMRYISPYTIKEMERLKEFLTRYQEMNTNLDLFINKPDSFGLKHQKVLTHFYDDYGDTKVFSEILLDLVLSTSNAHGTLLLLDSIRKEAEHTIELVDNSCDDLDADMDIVNGEIELRYVDELKSQIAATCRLGNEFLKISKSFNDSRETLEKMNIHNDEQYWREYDRRLEEHYKAVVALHELYDKHWQSVSEAKKYEKNVAAPIYEMSKSFGLTFFQG